MIALPSGLTQSTVLHSISPQASLPSCVLSHPVPALPSVGRPRGCGSFPHRSCSSEAARAAVLGSKVRGRVGDCEILRSTCVSPVGYRGLRPNYTTQAGSEAPLPLQARVGRPPELGQCSGNIWPCGLTCASENVYGRVPKTGRL